MLCGFVIYLYLIQKKKMTNMETTVEISGRKGRRGVGIIKIAAMAAVLTAGCVEALAQRIEGFNEVEVGGEQKTLYFGYNAVRPRHTQTFPDNIFNTAVGTSGLQVFPGNIERIKCADANTGAIYELQNFAIGTPLLPGYGHRYYTGSLFYAANMSQTPGTTAASRTAQNDHATRANAWRRMINHDQSLTRTRVQNPNNINLTDGWNLADGVLWLIVHWGDGGVSRYEMTLNNQW